MITITGVTDFDHALYHRRMSEYYSMMSKYHKNLRVGNLINSSAVTDRESEQRLPLKGEERSVKISEISYTPNCISEHEYYNNDHGQRCVHCGSMKITTCNINLPYEIISLIVCINNVFNGLTLSKEIRKESIKYAIPLSFRLTPISKERDLVNRYDYNKYLKYVNENKVISISACGSYSSYNYVNLWERNDNHFTRYKKGTIDNLPDYGYAIAFNQVRILERRFDALEIVDKKSYLREYFYYLKSHLTDFQYAVYLLCNDEKYKPLDNYIISDVIKIYEPPVKKLFKVE